jgi:antitoxin HigA-1
MEGGWRQLVALLLVKRNLREHLGMGECKMRTIDGAPDHPGMILKKLYLDTLHISNAQFAKHIGVSRQTISRLVNGRRAVTPEMALRLSRVFKLDPELWLHMQAAYDLWQTVHGSPNWQKGIKVSASQLCNGSSW